MKRRLALLLVVSVLMTMVMPSVSLAETLSGAVVVDGEYYYEDFIGYTGASGWFDTVSTNGYYSTSDDIFSKYSDDENGNGLKIVNKTTSFKSFFGPRGNNDTYFDVSTAQFEDAGATLVFSADVLIKDALEKDGSGLYINLHALQGEWQNLNSTLHSVSALPMYTKHWSKGASFFVPIKAEGNTDAGWTGGNATDYVTTTKTDGSSWVNLASVVTYDKTNEKYVTTSYVDGKPIRNATSGEISKLEVPASLTDVAKRTRFGISVNYRAYNTDKTIVEYAVVDNLAMYLCDTAVPQTGTVNGKTITIPFKNGKMFTNASTTPEIVKNCYLDTKTVTNAKLTTESGDEISGATFTATSSEVKVTVPASVGGGDKVKVDLNGVKDIAGNQVGLDTNTYTIGTASSDPVVPPVTGSNVYYYEDFEGYTGSDGWFDTSSTNGYYSNTGNIFSKYTDANNGTGLKIVNKTKSFKSFNGPRGSNEKYFSISPQQFEDADASLVFSADVLIKDALTVDSSGLFINLHAIKGDWQNINNTLYSISALPMYTKHWQKGASFFVPISSTGNTQAGWTGGNATDCVTTTKTDGSSWVNLTSVVTYDKTSQKYVTTSYVDGIPIRNANTGEVSRLEVPASSTDVATRTRLGVSVNYRANNTDTDKDEYAVVDNMCIRLHNGITVDAYMKVPSNSGNIIIPLYNGYEYSGDDVPEYVKKGVAVSKSAGLKKENIVIEKFDRDDKLLLNGTTMDNYTGTLSDGKVRLSNIEPRQNDEKLRITIKGIESVDGKEMLNSTLLVASEENFKGVTESSFIDINGEKMKITSSEAVPTDVSKLKLALRNVANGAITDGNVTYTMVNGTFDFKDNPLKPNTVYTIKLDGDDYTTFKTAANGTLSLANVSCGVSSAGVGYVNTTDEDKTVYFVVMYFNSSNKLVKVTAEPKNAPKNSSDTISATLNAPSDSEYSKIVLLDGLKTVGPLTTQFVSKEYEDVQPSAVANKELAVSSFDNEGNAVVSGTLNEKAKKRITAVLLDKNENVVYANDLYTNNDGSYSFEINMPSLAETGTYKLYVSADSGMLANGKDVHYSKDASAALSLLNGASSADEAARVIRENQADLEFYYDEYYTLFDDSDKLAVAALILKEKNDLKATNGVGFITTDKQTAVDAFGKAVVVRAATLGKVTDYSEVVSYFDELSTGVVYKWLDNNGGKEISSELRNKWRTGVLNRLKGASFTSYEDFIVKLKASLVFECIADSDGYGNIKGILTDYVSNGYIDGLSIAYVTNAVCSKLVDKAYSGFEYTQLISDISTYYNATPNGSNNGFGGSGGGGSTFASGSESPEPIDGELKDISDTESGDVNERFKDIQNSWAKDIIIELNDAGIISGNGDGTFEPERNITREEFAAIIVRMLDLSEIFDAEIPFKDVTGSDWCYDTVKIAYQHGIVNGKSISEFGMGEYISRQDMAVMLKNVADMCEITAENEKIDFDDVSEISDYAYTAVETLTSFGFINGYEDNTFRPNGLATRAEAAKVIYGVFKTLSAEIQ